MWRGNNLHRKNNDAFHDILATNEKVIIDTADAQAGAYEIHVTSSEYFISEKPYFAVVVSGLGGSDIPASGANLNLQKTSQCVGTGANGAQCSNGVWQCPAGFAGTFCEQAYETVDHEGEVRFGTVNKEVRYFRIPKEKDDDTVSFKAKGLVSRVITVCTSDESFQKVAAPGVSCVSTSEYTGSRQSQSGMAFQFAEKEDGATLQAGSGYMWGAYWCSSNKDCDVVLSWEWKEKKSKISPGVILAIIVVVVVVLGGLGFLAFYCYKKRQKSGEVSAHGQQWGVAP
jgi:hypothetical protein